MRKFFLLICILFLLLPVFAVPADNSGAENVAAPDSYLDLHGQLKDGTNLKIDVGIALDQISVADVGFSSKAITALNDKMPALPEVALSSKGERYFSSTSDVYMYYRLIASKNNSPTITLSIDSPLVCKDKSISNVVDWSVSWSMTVENAVVPFKITSAKIPGSESSKVIYSKANGKSAGSVLESEFNSFKLSFSTEEPYWNDPIAAYSGNLWLKITGV